MTDLTRLIDEVADLTTATTNLLGEVSISKGSLDTAVDKAEAAEKDAEAAVVECQRIVDTIEPGPQGIPGEQGPAGVEGSQGPAGVEGLSRTVGEVVIMQSDVAPIGFTKADGFNLPQGFIACVWRG